MANTISFVLPKPRRGYRPPWCTSCIATSCFLKAFFSSLTWCAPVPLLNLSMRATVARATVRVMQATHSLGHVSECGGDCLRARPLCLTPSSRLRTAAVPKPIPQQVCKPRAREQARTARGPGLLPSQFRPRAGQAGAHGQLLCLGSTSCLVA